MALAGHSFKSVKTWANQHFATEFEELPGARYFNFQLYSAPGYHKTGHIIGLVVGTTHDENQKPVDLLAWLDDHRTKIGLAVQKNSGTYDFHLKMFADEAVRFNEPFCWILAKRDKRAVARFKALVRYCFLMKGTKEAVEDKFHDFSTHFPGACRDVAAGTDRMRNEQSVRNGAAKAVGAENRSTDESANVSNDLYELELFARGWEKDTTVTIFSSPSPSPPPAEDMFDSTATTLSVKTEEPEKKQPVVQNHNHNSEQEYATFRARLVNDFNAICEKYEKEKQELFEKMQDLENRLSVAEGRASKAEEETDIWKGKYEKLRKQQEIARGRHDQLT